MKTSIVALLTILSWPVLVNAEELDGDEESGFSVHDKRGNYQGSANPSPLRGGGYAILDRNGRYQGSVVQDPYYKDGYILRDKEGRYKGQVRKTPR